MPIKTSKKLSCRFSLSIAVAAVIFASVNSYQAFAGDCTGSTGVYTCSGAANSDTTQTLTNSTLQVTTASDFGILTSLGNAISLIATNGLSFIDEFSASITGAETAIEADNFSSGALSIKTTGTVTGINDAGITVFNDVTATDILIRSAQIIAKSHGIDADNDGTGYIDITVSGTITSDDMGLFANNSTNGTNLIISTANVVADDNGIRATNLGTGLLSITTGDVSSTSYEGIFAENHGTNLSIITSTATGDYDAIQAENLGSGSLSITATGKLTAMRYEGIEAENSANGTDIIINAAAISAANDGINVANYGTGEISINSSGDIIAGGEGVYAANLNVSDDPDDLALGTDIAVTTASIDAQGHGIEVINSGSGVLNVTANGTITSGDVAIFATNNHGTDLVINTEAVNGVDEGIGADNYGTGVLSITATGAVVGQDDEGIDAESHGTDLIISVTSVNGGDDGIAAVNRGTGDINITATDTITAGDEGIYATNIADDDSAAGTNIIINVAAVTAGDEGVSATNTGSGEININVSGTVNAGHYGVEAKNSADDGSSAGTSITINTAAVVSGDDGIYAYNTGTGAVTITTTGVINAGDDGISAENESTGTDLTITTTAAITGADEAIVAANYGTGALTVNANASLVGNGDEGLQAINYNGTDLIINTVDIYGDDTAIWAENSGTGALTIIATGALTGIRYDGIDADNSGTDLTIEATTITAKDDGIQADNQGSGALTITTTGKVTAGDDGLYLENAGTDTNVTTVEVYAEDVAISVNHNGSGELNITTNGLITSNTDIAIRLNRAPTSNVSGTITNNAGWVSNNSIALELHSGFDFTGTINTSADITGGGGTAIDTSGTTTDFTINQSAGTITGDLLFGTGDIVFNITGGKIVGDIIGQGTGTVNANAGVGNSLSFYGITNVEDYNIQSGTAIQLGDFSTAGTTTTISQGATLQFNSVINGSGALVSQGNLAFNPGAQLNQTGNVTLDNGSSITANLQGSIASLTQQQYLTATSLINNGVSFESNSLLYDIEGNVTGNTIQANTVVADLASLSNDYNASQFGAAMKNYVENGATDSSVSALANLAADDISGYEQIASTLSPSVSGAISQGSRSIYNENWRAVLNQQLHPSSTQKSNVWIQAYDARVGAKKSQDIEGFSGQSTGIILGLEHQLGTWPTGIALNQGESSLTNKRASNDESDIDSTQLSLYTSYQAEKWFAHFNTSIASLDYKFDRDNTTNNSEKIRGKSKGELYGADISVGFNKIELEKFSIQPLLSLRYSHLAVDQYTESGGLGSDVLYENSETLSSNLQLHATMKSVTKGNWKITPIASLGWEHQFLDNTEEVQASYSGLSYLQRGAGSDNNSYNLGLGMKATYLNNISLGLQYSGHLSENSYQHSGAVNFQYSF